MRRVISTLSCALALLISVPATAQISTDLIEQRRADLQKQSTSTEMKREGGTQPLDWSYQLPEGVSTRQVTFYVDGGTPLYGKLSFPKGFGRAGQWPADVCCSTR